MEFHSAITTKDNLFKNLQEYMDTKVFNIVPMTFCIQSDSNYYKDDLNHFLSLLKLVHNYSNEKITKETFTEDFSKRYISNIKSK